MVVGMEGMESDLESDEELQELFAQGKLQPGLHALIPHVKKNVINNVIGMKNKLEEFKLNLDWIEKLDTTNDPAPVAPEIAGQLNDNEMAKNMKAGQVLTDEKVINDFKREMTFYRQAQAAVLECVPRLHKLSVITKRPDDYFAQMAKSDEHMKKVREKLLKKQLSMERSEKAKKLRELKKLGKKIQHEVIKKRKKEEKSVLDSIKKYRKGQTDKLDFLENSSQKSGRQMKKENFRKTKGNQFSRKKHEQKEKKYGYGGQKKRAKYNTADSAANMSGFRGRKSEQGKNFKKNQRPGKTRRQKLRNRKHR